MKGRVVSVGPTAVEHYGAKAFSRLPSDVRAEELWKLIGPTVDANLLKHPLWKVFAICYFEGLQHGVASLSASSSAARDVQSSAAQPGPAGTENSTTER